MTTQTELPDTLSFALRYAAAGFSVVPMHSVERRDDGLWCTCGKKHAPNSPNRELRHKAGKHPVPADWINRATTDPDVIRSWDWTSLNIGIVPPAGVSAFDVDPVHGGDVTWAAWMKEGELPKTPTARTGSGGLHVLFRVPEGRDLRRGEGIDPRRGMKNCLVVAPSRHASGNTYSWIVDPEHPIAELPAFLTEPEKPRKEPRTRSWDAVPGDFVQVGDGHCEMCGHNDCFHVHRDNPARWICWSTNHGRDSGGVGVEHSDGFWSGDSHDIDAWRMQVPVGDLLKSRRVDGVNLDGLLRGTADPGGTVTPQSATRRPFRLRSLKEVANAPPVSWLVSGLVPSKGLCVLAGDPGAGKSFLALDLALRVACGLPEWMGREVKSHGRVLLVALEGDGGVPARLRAWCAAHGLDEDRYAERLDLLDRWEAPHPPLSPMGAAVLRSLIAEQTDRYRLIVFDTLTLAAGCDENDAGEMGKVVAQAHRIANESGAAVQLIHHLRKPAAGVRSSLSMHDLRGSSALLGAADHVLGLQAPAENARGEPRRLLVLKAKDGPEAAPIGVRLDLFSTGWELEDGTQEKSAVPMRADLSEAERIYAEQAEARKEQEDREWETEARAQILRAFDDKPVFASIDSLADMARGRKMQRRRRLVKELVAEGLIAREGPQREPRYVRGSTVAPDSEGAACVSHTSHTHRDVGDVGDVHVPPTPPATVPARPRTSGTSRDVEGRRERLQGEEVEPFQDGADGLGALVQADIDDGMPTQPGGSRRRGKRT